jgi:hypothetical protein
VTVKAIEQEGNLHFPLPGDYDSLTEEGQRLARVNAASLWQLAPEYAVHSWDYFRNEYLDAGGTGRLEEGFFYDRPIPSPPAHYAWTYDLALNDLNIWAAPRGGAKSTVLTLENVMMRALTKPWMRILIVVSKKDFVEKRFAVFMRMFEENPLILRDFGEVKPKKVSSRIWNKHMLTLQNGTSITGLSAEGKKRGERTHLIIFDDPEKELADSTDVEAVRSNLTRMLFKVMMPMRRRGDKIALICTIDDHRGWTYHIATTQEDKRMQKWNRRVYTIENKIFDEEAQEEKNELFWEEMWDEKEIRTLKEEMGEDFYSEYMNDPLRKASAGFDFDPRLHGYEFQGENPNETADPLWVESKVQFNVIKSGASMEGAFVMEDEEHSWPQFVNGLYRIITVDFAPTVNPDSDFSAIHVMGFNRLDTLWSLDLWVGKKSEEVVETIIWQMASRWRPKIIAPEAVSIQKSLANRLQSDLGVEAKKMGYRPAVLPITGYGRVDKKSRIGGLGWRFRKGHVKFPLHRLGTWPYSELMREIGLFHPTRNTMDKDDALDSMAMANEVVRPARREAALEGP